MSSALVALLALLCGGCAKQQVQKSPAPPSPTAADRAYRTLTENLGVDVTPLRDRVIVLDPGHGGSYRGAMGPGGTAEADVNLAVGLFLWGLLHDAGAQVHLTRTVDRDLVGGAPHPPAIRPLPSEAPLSAGAPAEEPALVSADSVPADLAARVEAANALSPDLFLSLHHNADAGGDSTRNQTLTFYRLSDAGPSLDAARSIHRHLMRNLGTASGEVRPGNYHVLRNSRAIAAVLGEPSFLTNPAFEAKLGRIDRVELEATAYFLGIVDYFGRGVAHTLLTQPRAAAGAGDAVELSAAFIGSPVDPGSVRIALDGRPLIAYRVPTAGYTYVAAMPAAEVANGRHRATAEARCLGGNAVAPGELQLEIRRPPAEIHAEPWPAWNGGAFDGALGLAVEVRDRFGLPVADSTRVELLEPIAAAAPTTAGRAWFVLDPGGAPPRRWRVTAMGHEAVVPAITKGAPAALTGSIRATGSGQPVMNAELRAGAGGAVLGYSNPAGRFAVSVSDAQIQASAPGYLPAPVNRHQPIAELAPVLGGVLFGRALAIDAAGGGSEPLQVSPTGLRASDATLMAARALASELTWAGAHPVLLRADDRTLPDLARVEAAEAAHADLYVRFGAGPAPKIRHYPGSQRGSRLAQVAAAEIQAECGLTLPVAGEVTPILLLTSSPAIEIVLPAPTDHASEDQLLDPAFLRRLGRALAIALAADHGLVIANQGTVRLAAPRILLDGRTILTAPGGEALLLRALEPTPAWHEATALSPEGEPGATTHFSVAAGDTVDLKL